MRADKEFYLQERYEPIDINALTEQEKCTAYLELKEYFERKEDEK